MAYYFDHRILCILWKICFTDRGVSEHKGKHRWIAKVCSDGNVAYTILPLRPHRRYPRASIQRVCSLSCYQPWEHSNGFNTNSINRVNLSIQVTAEKFFSMNTSTFKEIHVKIIDRKCYIYIVDFHTASQAPAKAPSLSTPSSSPPLH